MNIAPDIISVNMNKEPYMSVYRRINSAILSNTKNKEYHLV